MPDAPYFAFITPIFAARSWLPSGAVRPFRPLAVRRYSLYNTKIDIKTQALQATDEIVIGMFAFLKCLQ